LLLVDILGWKKEGSTMIVLVLGLEDEAGLVAGRAVEDAEVDECAVVDGRLPMLVLKVLGFGGFVVEVGVITGVRNPRRRTPGLKGILLCRLAYPLSNDRSIQ
jgi:hypothetical protein